MGVDLPPIVGVRRPWYQLKRLQSRDELRCLAGIPVVEVYDHITLFLHELHWLKAAERIDYKLALRAYKCLQGAAPSYLADELREPADFAARCRLRSASSSSLVIRRTRLSTVGNRAFPVAAARVWSSLPQHVTSAHAVTASLSQSP